MDSVNSVAWAFRLITICHREVLSESSQEPNLTQDLSLRMMFLWDCSGQCSQWQKGASLATGTECSVSVPGSVPAEQWPPHPLPMGYAHSQGLLPEVRVQVSSGFAVKHCCNRLHSCAEFLPTGLKWWHSDFFPCSPLCLLSL